MRTSTICAAFAAVLMSGAVAIPVPAPAAVAVPAIEAREPQLLSSLFGGGSSSQSDSSQSGNEAGNANKNNGNSGNGGWSSSTEERKLWADASPGNKAKGNKASASNSSGMLRDHLAPELLN